MKQCASRCVRVSVVFLLVALVVPSVCADEVSDAVDHVSLGQYQIYQAEIESMGLGFYGGPSYDQGYRNRDGWAGGGTLGNDETRLYLADQFAAMGLDVSVQGTYLNVVGELPGLEKPEEIYIVSGHFDTTSNGEKPGGDDNASGTAGVLEAARVLTQYRFKSTLRFIGFNAEEDWMKGSQDYVDTVVLPNNENILGVVNLDMILRPGWDADPDAAEDLDVITGESAVCLAWADVFIAAAAVYGPSAPVDPASPTTSYWYASDQGPFISAGYPALLVIENTATDVWGGSNAYYHSSGDASDGPANDPNSASGVVYDYAFATDVVRATVATVAMGAEPLFRSAPSFSRHQVVSSERADDLEFFTIGDTDFLAVAREASETTYSVDSVIYRWDGTGFVEHQRIPTHGACDWEFFTIADEHYLAVANQRDDSGYAVDSQIYRWDGNAFVAYQAIPTKGASDWEFFTIGGEGYLAVAHISDGVTYNVDSMIYQWDGEIFIPYQALPTHGASDWEFFRVDGDSYLVVANGYDGSTHELDSKVYRWTGTLFVESQSLATTGAADCEFFTIDDTPYLAVANAQDDSGADVDSYIYQCEQGRFVRLQSVRTAGAADWEFFTIDDVPYLAVANADEECRVYRWTGKRFVEFVPISSRSARDCEFFALGENPFLGIADGSESVVYLYRTACSSSLDGDCDVDLRDYAIFAQTWRLEQDQPGWNADCDLSRPRDGIVDVRDLAVLAGNWLRK